jgi:hypothetical protein
MATHIQASGVRNRVVALVATTMLVAVAQNTRRTYLHGLRFNDVSTFKSAFHPEAKLMFVRKVGQLGQLTQEQWYKGFEASAGKEEKGDLRIVSCRYLGNAGFGEGGRDLRQNHLHRIRLLLILPPTFGCH